jgi:hypothetical protein
MAAHESKAQVVLDAMFLGSEAARPLRIVAVRPHGTSFVVMRELKLSQALTTDHHFAQAGFEALLLNSA